MNNEKDKQVMKTSTDHEVGLERFRRLQVLNFAKYGKEIEALNGTERLFITRKAARKWKI